MKNFKFQISNFKLVSFLLLATCYLLLTTPIFAQTPTPMGVDLGSKFGFGGFSSLGEVVSKLVNPMFEIAAACVVLYFLFGAFKYIQSRGNKEELAAAQGIIIHAVIGFIILMFAFLILQFLLSSLFQVEGFKII